MPQSQVYAGNKSRIHSLRGNGLSQGGIRFPWVQEATFEGGVLTPNPTGVDSVVGPAAMVVNSAAAMAGLLGLSVGIPSAVNRVARFSGPVNEIVFNLEFLFDPNSIVMANGDSFFLVTNLSAGAGGAAFQVLLIKNGANYESRVIGKTDAGGNMNLPDFIIQDTAQLIGIEWTAAINPGDNDGSIEAFVNGVSVGSRFDIDNDTHDVQRVDTGAVAGIDPGTSGTIFFDNIRWARQLIG